MCQEEDLPALPRVTSSPLFVCKPDMMNITVIFTTLLSFTHEVEVATLSGARYAVLCTLSVCLSVRPSVCLSVCLLVYLFASLCFSLCKLCLLFSKRCSLRNFIEDYIQQNFLEFVSDDLNDKLEAAIKGKKQINKHYIA